MKNLTLTLAISFFASCFVYGQLTERRIGTTASAAGYIEYLPASYKSNPTKRLPIILFFHGSGEGGNGTTDLSKIYNTGLPAMIKNNSWTYKDQFVVLMPQHNSTSTCFGASEIKNFIDFARKAYRVDTLQVFLTGLSCGANGLWRYIGAYPSNDIVAAAAPISGNSLSAYTAAGCNITIPLWAFHGGSDQTSPTKNDIAGHDSFNLCPTPHAEASLTVYPGVGHNCWDMTYDLSAGHDIYAWFLKHRSPLSTINQAPTDIQLSALEVKENQPIGTVVGTFSTTDANIGDTFTYTLEIAGTNNDKNSFSINNGTLRTNAVFDFESKSNYRIKVRSTDKGGLYDEKWFDFIKVVDVNETPTNITLSSNNVKEKQPTLTVVGDFTTTDPDINNTFIYTLESGGTNNDKNFFNINNGKLETKAVFDFSTKSSYRIKVRSTDQGALYDEVWFDINVLQDITTGFNSAIEEDRISLFPNPVVNDELYIRNNSEVAVLIEVFNSYGAIVMAEEVVGNSKINTSDWKSGLYFVRVKNEKQTQSIKITVVR